MYRHVLPWAPEVRLRPFDPMSSTDLDADGRVLPEALRVRRVSALGGSE